jgi:hypothetical protein
MNIFTINIVRNGHHWAKMLLAQGTLKKEATQKTKSVRQRFVADDGWEISLTTWSNPDLHDILNDYGETS